MAIGWQRQIVGCESITSIDADSNPQANANAEQVTVVSSAGLRLVTVGLADFLGLATSSAMPTADDARANWLCY